MPQDPKQPPPDSFLEALRAVSLQAAADALELTQRAKALREEFDGTPLAGAEGSSVADAPRQRPGEIVYEALRLQMQLASQLLTLGHKQADFWLDRARRAGAAVLPRDRMPPTRLTCKRQRSRWSPPIWTCYIYNAVQTKRSVRFDGRGNWRRADGATVNVPVRPTIAVTPPNACGVDAQIGAHTDQRLSLTQEWTPSPPANAECETETFQAVADVVLDEVIVGRIELVLIVEP